MIGFKRTMALVAFGATLAAGGIVVTTAGVEQTLPKAEALPDPYVPQPPLWCPGNPPGLSASGYGGYCEGKSFPDGTRINMYRVGYFWQPMRCIIPNGSPFPEEANWGCGGIFR